MLSRTTNTDQPPTRTWDTSPEASRLIAQLDRRLPGWDRRASLRALDSNGRRADDEVSS